jgi:hypothetical protein
MRWLRSAKPTEWIQALAVVFTAVVLWRSGLLDAKKSELNIQGTKLELDQKALDGKQKRMNEGEEAIVRLTELRELHAQEVARLGHELERLRASPVSTLPSCAPADPVVERLYRELDAQVASHRLALPDNATIERLYKELDEVAPRRPAVDSSGRQ